MRIVTILGAGSWGTALTVLLQRVPEVRLWSRDAEHAGRVEKARRNEQYLPELALARNVVVTCDIQAALTDADCVVLAIPSEGYREVARLAAPFIPPTALLVNASKGMEPGTAKRLSEALAEEIAQQSPAGVGNVMSRVAALSGPNLAVEVARGVPTASVAASSSPETARLCQELWMGPTFRVYRSLDLIGVELAGAMKNIYAIGAGVCEGVGFGDNSRAALLTRGLAEMTRLGVALGAQRATFHGLAGVGDLIATSCSRLSRNFRLGVALGQGTDLGSALAELGQVAEGVPTTRAVRDLARRHAVEMPVTEALYGALYEGASVPETVRALMMRPARDECEEQPGLR